MRLPTHQLAVLNTVLFATTALAQAGAGSSPMRDAIEQALGRSTTLTVTKKPIREALTLIGNHAGVRLTISDRTADLLPFGPGTVVSVSIVDKSLRQGLEGMLRPAGMTIAIGNEHIEVVPTAPLRRLGRRPQPAERKLLVRLAEQPFSVDLPFQFRIPQAVLEQVGDPKKALLDRVATVAAGSASAVLEQACVSLGWTWFPLGENLVILTQRQQTERLLQQPISARYSGQPLGKVILDLARQVGLSVSFTPGVLVLLPPTTREKFSLLADGVTLADAFNQIAAATGLTYAVRDTDVHFTASPALTRAAPSPAAEPVLFWITAELDGGIRAMIPVYASDCPPELKALITRKKADILQAWRKTEPEK